MRALTICLALLLAGPVHALSCMRPDAVRLFETARDAEERFYIVKGEVAYLEPVRTPDPNGKATTRTRARITGMALTASGFGAPFDRDVTLEATCLGVWCGKPGELGGTRIMALEVRPGGLVLDVGPCGGDQLAWEASQEDRLLKCHLEGDCRPAEF